jgi:hypothetical protein
VSADTAGGGRNAKEQARMSAKMEGRENEPDGPANGLEAFAQELKAQREAAGLTQEQLAKLMGYSASVIAKLETCRTVASPQHASKADEALKLPGTFRRLRKAAINGTYEPWFQAFIDIETGPLSCGGGSLLWFLACCRPRDTLVAFCVVLVRQTVTPPSSSSSRRGCPGRRSGSGKTPNRPSCR